MIRTPDRVTPGSEECGRRQKTLLGGIIPFSSDRGFGIQNIGLPSEGDAAILGKVSVDKPFRRLLKRFKRPRRPLSRFFCLELRRIGCDGALLMAPDGFPLE